MRITFLTTGGTIDKDYPRASGGYAFEFGEPATDRLLAKLDPSFAFEVEIVCQKDSTDLDDDDRAALADRIGRDTNDAVVVTHGTDTILDTARYLAARCRGKRIVLTGAMRPERFADSDAAINFGCAIGAANLVDEGVFVAMHGIVKRHDQMERDPRTGRYR